MDLSPLRQRIHRLNRRRGQLIQKVLRPGKMIQGSLYKMKRTCGNPRCRCAKGEKHPSWYLSRLKEGKTKLTYIGRIVPDWVWQRVNRYRHHQKLLSEIRKIDSEISRLLNQIREAMVEQIEEVTLRTLKG